jgi:hypothetical protein
VQFFALDRAIVYESAVATQVVLRVCTALDARFLGQAARGRLYANANHRASAPTGRAEPRRRFCPAHYFLLLLLLRLKARMVDNIIMMITRCRATGSQEVRLRRCGVRSVCCWSRFGAVAAPVPIFCCSAYASPTQAQRATMSYKIYTYPENSRVWKAQIAAAYTSASSVLCV